MKISRKLLLWLCLIAIFFFLCVSTLVNTYGLLIARKIIRRVSNAEVTLKGLTYQFPLGIVLRDVSIENDLKVPWLTVQFDPRTFFSKDTYIWSIKLAGADISAPFSLSLTPGSNSFFINKIRVSDATVHYIDPVSGNEEFLLSDMVLKLKNTVLPANNQPVRFWAKARISSRKLFLSKQIVDVYGWLDFNQKDLAAELALLTAAKKPLLTADIVSKNNIMRVNGRVFVKDLLSFIRSRKPAQLKAGQEPLFNQINSLGIDAGVNFSFVTQMDHFKIDKVKIEGSVDTKNLDE